MKNFTNLTFLILLLLGWQTSLMAQNSTCATAALLVLDTNCGGVEGGPGANSGDPTGNDDTDGNVCSANYSNGDDFIFEYTATTTGALVLDLFATNSWTGLMVTAGCPTTGTCFASSNSSSTDESLTTPSMTIGQVYYIHISTYPSPQSAGQFCLDAALVAPPMPPANNDCANATPVGVNADLSCGTTVSGTIELATASGEDELTCSGTEDDDVWFSFVATATSHEISLINVANGTTDLYHSVWSGTCGALTNIVCSDPNNSTASGLTIGNTYLLRVYSWTSTSGQTTDFDVCIGTLPSPPSNDACAGAIELVGNHSQNSSGSTIVETLSGCSGGGGGGTCVTGGGGTVDFSEGVWYYYTSTLGGESMTISTANVGTDFDTELAVYSGTCGGLTCVGGDDDGGDATGHNFDSEFCWVSTASFAPVTYYIYVDGHNGATGNFVLTFVTDGLPVELVSFNAKAMEEENMVTWQTASEENTEWHVVERSKDGLGDWEEIGRIEAAGTSAEILSYEFMDTNPMAVGYYRLRSVDFDAYEDISNVVRVERQGGIGDVQVHPNPVRATANVTFELGQGEDVSIALYDMTGRIISAESIKAARGTNTHELDMSALANGVYFMSMESSLGKVTQRIVKN